MGRDGQGKPKLPAPHHNARSASPCRLCRRLLVLRAAPMVRGTQKESQSGPKAVEEAPEFLNEYCGWRPRASDASVPVVDAGIDPREFYERYILTRRPCIIAGHIRDKEWKVRVLRACHFACFTPQFLDAFQARIPVSLPQHQEYSACYRCANSPVCEHPFGSSGPSLDE